MPMNNLTKIYTCWKMYKEGISPKKIPRAIDINRATIYRWIRGIKRKGYRVFVREYVQAKKGRRKRNKTDPTIKCKIYRIRQEYHECCGQKIQWILKKDYGIDVSITTIYRILGNKYQLRSKWKKNIWRGKVIKGTKPREVIQIDTVDFGRIYAFTAIDTYTKEAHVVLQEKLDSEAGAKALVKHLEYFGKIQRIQKDGGSEFKDKWVKKIRKTKIMVRIARPYRKNEQAFIERFNGILRKECLGHLKYSPDQIPELQKLVNSYLHYYHYKRPHLSLQMLTPIQFSMSHLT